MSDLWTFTHLLFGLDGTLTDSKPAILRCVQYALEQCGCPETDEEKLAPFIGPPLFESFQQIISMNPEQATFAVQQYRERFSRVGMFENAVYDGIPELLTVLRKAGFTLAVATAKPEVYTLQILEHFQLTGFFTAIAGSDISREGETKADVIHLALQRLGLPQQNAPGVVMIGDRKHNAIGAHTCGLPCVGVGYGYTPEGELAAYGVDAYVPTIDALGAMFLPQMTTTN
ncbi:MAG: HAD hydrolase-like protein [Ruminococcus sp.]|nr:HAD hydrolase-like protein [Ruminococcus sp.]